MRSIVFAFVNSKGGGGKSTLCLNVARGLQIRGFKVGIVDVDPQGSVSSWAAAGNQDSDQPEVISIDNPAEIKQQTIALSKKYDFVVIDGVARDPKINVEIIRIADYVFMPLAPSAFDVYATNDLYALIMEMKKTNGNPDPYLVFNFCRNTLLTEETINTVKNAKVKVNVLKSTISIRDVYKKCGETGLTVFELPDYAARTEMEMLVNEIIKVMKK